MALLTIFVLSVFVGFEVIAKVSSVLHTPLMSGANAIHGIVLIGAITVAGAADNDSQFWLAIVAVVLASMNLVGGFVVTDRMLEMFARAEARRRAPTGRPADERTPTWVALAYLLAAVCFILALKGLSSPRTARRGQPDRCVRRGPGHRHAVPRPGSS